MQPLSPDPQRAQEAAQRMLDRYEANVHEDNIRDDICTFLVEAGLAAHDDLVREANRIDIQSENLVIEVKRRIGRTRTIEPDSENVAQLDRYLEQARRDGKPERLGILTDGRHWVLRLPGIEEVQTVPPYAFTLAHAAPPGGACGRGSTPNLRRSSKQTARPSKNQTSAAPSVPAPVLRAA